MDIQIQNQREARMKGTHIISVCKMTSERAQQLETLIENNAKMRQFLISTGQETKESLRKLWEEYKYLLDLLHRKFLTQQVYVENVTCTVGRAVFAQRLAGDNTYTGNITYGALGTDNSAPAVGDTQLGTETYRKALSSGTDASNQAFLENFYTAAEVNGTFEEYGFFIDGAAGANTGQLFNRFTQQVVKTNTESLNVQSTITINDA